MDVMLYGPEHALTLAANAVETHAKTPDMAVGIIIGVRSAIEEYARMIGSAATTELPAQDKTESKSDEDKARTRVSRLTGAGAR